MTGQGPSSLKHVYAAFNSFSFVPLIPCSTPIGAKVRRSIIVRITRHSEKLHRFYLYRCKEIFELFHRLFSCCLTVSSIRIDIRSEGCNDPGRTPNTCGRAYIKVNGNEHSKQNRGHNVVVVNAVTGKGLK